MHATEQLNHTIDHNTFTIYDFIIQILSYFYFEIRNIWFVHKTTEQGFYEPRSFMTLKIHVFLLAFGFIISHAHR